MIKPFYEAIRRFRSEPFRAVDVVKKLGYAEGYARNFLSQATRQGFLIGEHGKARREKTFRANPLIVREIVLRSGKDKEALLNALGLTAKYAGEYVAMRGFEVVDHDIDLYELGERVFSDEEARNEVVITSIGVPKKILTFEI